MADQPETRTETQSASSSASDSASQQPGSQQPSQQPSSSLTRRHGAVLLSRPGFRTPGSGRKPGGANKLTIDVRAMILRALHSAGGDAYLAAQAISNPSAFLALVGKVLPLQVKPMDGEPQLIARRIIHIHKQLTGHSSGHSDSTIDQNTEQNSEVPTTHGSQT